MENLGTGAERISANDFYDIMSTKSYTQDALPRFLVARLPVNNSASHILKSSEAVELSFKEAPDSILRLWIGSRSRCKGDFNWVSFGRPTKTSLLL